MRRLRVSVIAPFILSGATWFAGGQEPTTSVLAPGHERIAYMASRPGNWDIYRFDTPGGRPQRLTDDPGADYDAVASPDGRWVVFCSERRGNPDLYALDLSGTAAPRLLIDSDAMEDQRRFPRTAPRSPSSALARATPKSSRSRFDRPRP
jgi:hypothetical protein